MAENENKHVLLADDDPLLRRLFGGKLAAAGFDIIYATNGPDAREEARRLNPDIILMDINMPGFENGLATANRLKREEETKHIPIFLLTNVDASLEAEKKLTEIAADGYLHKSMELNEMVEKIKNFLEPKKEKN